MKKPRLTDADRLEIEHGLREGKTMYAIAVALGRPSTTISREIQARMVDSDKGAAFRVTNRCANRMTCELRHVCQVCFQTRKNMACKFCRQCNSHCRNYVEQKCERLDRPPFVCNGCKDEHKCVLRKRYYIHSKAQDNYATLLSESRKGANITERELLSLDAALHDFTSRGLSVHAAMVGNPDAFAVSEKSVYRYINGGLLTTRRHELPMVCRLKPRKAKSVEHRVDKHCRMGRTWDDFCRFREEHMGVRVAEMDTVEGVKGGKVLMTLIFLPSRFMVAFLLDAKTSKCVINVFANIIAALRRLHGDDGWRDAFACLFPVILTDNGSEFSNPAAIEFDSEGGRLTFVFYCNAYASYQKPHVERNHEFIRRVLPKATMYTEPTPFDGLDKEQVALMMSHINSYPRRELDGKTPYDLFVKEYGEATAELFGIVRVDACDVTLKPSLLGVEVKTKKRAQSPEK